MKLFQPKIKKATMFVDYTPMDAMIYVHSTAPHRIHEVSAESPYPFFIKLLKKPFENWIIEITGMDSETSFSTIVDSVPNTVSDKQFNKLQPELKTLLSAVVNDILSTSLEPLKPIIISEEKEK